MCKLKNTMTPTAWAKRKAVRLAAATQMVLDGTYLFDKLPTPPKEPKSLGLTAWFMAQVPTQITPVYE